MLHFCIAVDITFPLFLFGKMHMDYIAERKDVWENKQLRQYQIAWIE